MQPRTRLTRSGLLGTIAFAAVNAVAAGCSDTATKGLIRGTVRFNDLPLTSGTVTFLSRDGKTCTGEIGRDGDYQVQDVPIGPARVTVSTRSRVPPGLQGPKNVAIPQPPGADKQPAPVAIPEKYQHPDRSGMTCTVSAGEQSFDIDLRR